MVSTRIGCTKIQETTWMEESRKTVGGKETNVREVSLSRLKGGVVGLNAWVWWRLGRGYLGVFRG